MNRFLDLASKALAVVGVLTLMYTGSGMQQAKADVIIVPLQFPCAPTWGPDGFPTGCKNGQCAPGDTCAFFPANVNNVWMCCI